MRRAGCADAVRSPAISSGAVRLWLLAAAVLIAFVLSFAIGRYAVNATTSLAILASKIFNIPITWAPQDATIVLDIRMPRILAAMLIGVALSTSGAAYQGLFRNPLVSPDILGVSAGAGFGASIGILAAFGPIVVQALAFLGGLTAVLSTYAVASRFGRDGETTLVLILSGVIIGALFSAFISVVKYIADPDNTLPAITYWLMGGLSSIEPSDIYISTGPILGGFAVLTLIRWNLNIMAFGEEEARTLGISTGLVRTVVIAAATLMTASAVAISGVVGLVGLVVPHVARAYVGPNFSVLIPASALLGALFVLLMDNLARSLFSTEIPLGVLTELVGAPSFLFLLTRIRHGWI
jgi:iron complex transport system permease protein